MEVSSSHDRLFRTISKVASWDGLRQLETNIAAKGALSPQVQSALKSRATHLGAEYIAKETGLLLSELSDAEQKIVLAIGEYAALLKRQGKIPNRTLQQIRRRGLIDAAEAAVSKSKPTQGYQVLVDANLEDLSYEQIVLDHPDEFSPRAIWYARRTLGLPNTGVRPPAPSHSDISSRTTDLLGWLRARAQAGDGYIPPFENSEAAIAIGLGSLRTHGRVHGNIQSRVDFACYLCNLPPLGCAADVPFSSAWMEHTSSLQAVVQWRQWTDQEFDQIVARVNELPGIAHLSWRSALESDKEGVYSWIKRWARLGSKTARLGPKDERQLERLPVDVLSCATPEFIWAAVQRLIDGSVVHSFAPSTDFDLIADHHRLPPKAVFGVALSLAMGGHTIEPKHFSGGEGSACFRLLREAGYRVVPKDSTPTSLEDGPLMDTEWREGARKLVAHWKRERASGLANAKKAQFRRLHGKLTCEKCGLDPVEQYGTILAESCIEVHHATRLISEMADGDRTTLQDLECLCANCHRLAHRLIATRDLSLVDQLPE